MFHIFDNINFSAAEILFNLSAAKIFGDNHPMNKWYFSNNLSAVRPRKKNTLLSGNAGDEKNVHLGGRKIFLMNLIDFFK